MVGCIRPHMAGCKNQYFHRWIAKAGHVSGLAVSWIVSGCKSQPISAILQQVKMIPRLLPGQRNDLLGRVITGFR